MTVYVFYFLKQPSKCFYVFGGCFFFFFRCILVSIDIHVSRLKVFSVSYSRLLDLWKLGDLLSVYGITLDVEMISHDGFREV